MLFVMNPYAGMRKANRYLADILTLFNRADYEVTTYMTAGPGDAGRVVESYAPGMDLVVCCGGDGTLNETITGILRSGASWFFQCCGNCFFRRQRQRLCKDLR